MRRWLQRFRATSEEAASPGDLSQISELIDFLSGEISSAQTATPVGKRISSFSQLAPADQERQVAGLYLFVEQFLTEVDPAKSWTRSGLRTTVRQRFPELAGLAAMRLVFDTQSDQQARLSARYLIEACDRIHDLLGAHCEELLEGLPGWLDGVPDAATLPIPLAPTMRQLPANSREWSRLLRLVARRVYGRASGRLGAEATRRIFEGAYESVADCTVASRPSRSSSA